MEITFNSCNMFNSNIMNTNITINADYSDQYTIIDENSSLTFSIFNEISF